MIRDMLIWVGDHLPGRFGNWLLRTFSPAEEEPWVDAEGRMMPDDPALGVYFDVVSMEDGKKRDVIVARWPDGFIATRVGGREVLEDPFAAAELVESFKDQRRRFCRPELPL